MQHASSRQRSFFILFPPQWIVFQNWDKSIITQARGCFNHSEREKHRSGHFRGGKAAIFGGRGDRMKRRASARRFWLSKKTPIRVAFLK